MHRYAARFHPSDVDIELPTDLNTEALRAWLIQQIDALDVQRKQYQQVLQRYSNTRQGRKQHTPEEMAAIRAEQTILQAQRNAYRQLLGDLKAASKELARIQANHPTARQFAEVFVDVAREALPAETFNRLFTAALERTPHEETP